jgi:hypothetical protein
MVLFTKYEQPLQKSFYVYDYIAFYISAATLHT